jgi:hypothetical protein
VAAVVLLAMTAAFVRRRRERRFHDAVHSERLSEADEVVRLYVPVSRFDRTASKGDPP